MAKILLGPVASAISGSTGGTTFSRNKGGAYMRARVVPLNPKTAAQTVVRSNFAASAKAWSNLLTDTQRAAWTFFAQANPVMNTLGASIILSGLSMYTRLNQVLAQGGYAGIDDPPANLNIDPITPATVLNATNSGPSINFTTAAQSAFVNTSYYIFATGAMNAGRTPAQNQYRFIGTYAPALASVLINFNVPYFDLFGTPAVGTKIGARIAQVNTTSGALTPFLTFSTIVA